MFWKRAGKRSEEHSEDQYIQEIEPVLAMLGVAPKGLRTTLGKTYGMNRVDAMEVTKDIMVILMTAARLRWIMRCNSHEAMWKTKLKQIRLDEDEAIIGDA